MSNGSSIKEMPTDEVVDAKVQEALAPIVSALNNLTTALNDVYAKGEVFTKAQVNALIQQVAQSLATHVGSQAVHVSAQEKETWNAKLDSNSGYTKDAANSVFAAKSVEEVVAGLQSGKADAGNTYTKGQVDRLVRSMSGKTFNYGDWSNGSLAAAIRELYIALGGSIEGTQA